MQVLVGAGSHRQRLADGALRADVTGLARPTGTGRAVRVRPYLRSIVAAADRSDVAAAGSPRVVGTVGEERRTSDGTPGRTAGSARGR